MIFLVYLKDYNVRNEKPTKEDGPWAEAHGSDCVLPQAGTILTVEAPPLCGFGFPFGSLNGFFVWNLFEIWNLEFGISGGEFGDSPQILPRLTLGEEECFNRFPQKDIGRQYV